MSEYSHSGDACPEALITLLSGETEESGQTSSLFFLPEVFLRKAKSIFQIPFPR